jgi:hypothetical protein
MSFALCCVVLTCYLDNKFRVLAILCNNTKIWNDSKSMIFLSFQMVMFGTCGCLLTYASVFNLPSVSVITSFLCSCVGFSYLDCVWWVLNLFFVFSIFVDCFRGRVLGFILCLRGNKELMKMLIYGE